MVLERVLATAELASLGITATEDAIEAAFSCLSTAANRPIDPTPIERLGQHWYLSRNMIKVYPAQVYTQAVIEAALGLHQRNVRADRIGKLIFYGNRYTCAGVQGSAQAFVPASREAADHSTPFVLAVSLLRGRLTSREFDNAPWDTSEVKALMAKIDLVDDSEWNRSLDAQGILGGRLVATLADGGMEEIIVRQPKGHPDMPLSNAELLGKMTSLLKDIAPAHIAERLFDNCSRLSSAEDVRRLIGTSNVSTFTTAATPGRAAT
jgi:2-methylcitrate dehydratase